MLSASGFTRSGSRSLCSKSGAIEYENPSAWSTGPVPVSAYIVGHDPKIATAAAATARAPTAVAAADTTSDGRTSVLVWNVSMPTTLSNGTRDTGVPALPALASTPYTWPDPVITAESIAAPGLKTTVRPSTR